MGKPIETWADVKALIASTGAKNVQVVGESLRGNDGTVLSYDVRIAAGYVRSDWDAVNCRATR